MKRHSISASRSCSLGVITFEDRKLTNTISAKLMDVSITGVGLESDQLIEPGMIWFNEDVLGHRCGVVAWCKYNGARYKTGIQFISLDSSQERYIGQQVRRSKPNDPIQDPERVLESLLQHIMMDRNGRSSVSSLESRNVQLPVLRLE